MSGQPSLVSFLPPVLPPLPPGVSPVNEQTEAPLYGGVWFRRPNRYFKARSHLLDECSFVAHYHHTTGNIVLHLLGWSVMEVALLWLVCSFFGSGSGSGVGFGVGRATIFGVPSVAVVVAVMYSGYHFTLDSMVGGLAIMRHVLMLQLLVKPLSAASNEYEHHRLYAVAAIGVAGLAQVVGHRIFEKKFPAFRAFEAAVTTPFYLWLSVLFWCGYKPALAKRIRELSDRWKEEERPRD